MSAKDLLLAIDNGTQSLKALIFDLEGQLLVKELVAFRPYFSEQPTWAEQDPDVFWQALCRACQGLWRQIITTKSALPVWPSPPNGVP
jgi:sugar (pentulose or hexulose) kinase